MLLLISLDGRKLYPISEKIYLPSYGIPSTLVLNLLLIPSDSLKTAEDLMTTKVKMTFIM